MRRKGRLAGHMRRSQLLHEDRYLAVEAKR